MLSQFSSVLQRTAEGVNAFSAPEHELNDRLSVGKHL